MSAPMVPRCFNEIEKRNEQLVDRFDATGCAVILTGGRDALIEKSRRTASIASVQGQLTGRTSLPMNLSEQLSVRYGNK